jgi:hypothetical protein
VLVYAISGCLMGDAATTLPHIAAGQAKACADAWELHDAPAAADGHVVPAVDRWEETEVSLETADLSRTRVMGAARQFDGAMVPRRHRMEARALGAG